jgi:hypothetical protein
MPTITEAPKSTASTGLAAPLAALPDPAPDLLTQLNETHAALERSHGAIAALTTERETLAARLRELDANPFLYALNHLDAGQVLREAGEQMKVVTSAVDKLRGKGKVTITLGIGPMKGSTALVLQPSLKITKPEPDPEPGVFFATEDGALTRHDPKQRELWEERQALSQK